MSTFAILLIITAVLFALQGLIAQREEDLNETAAALLRDNNSYDGGVSENPAVIALLFTSRGLELRAKAWGQLWTLTFLAMLGFFAAAVVELAFR